jgi:hypothetical protein
MFKFFPRFNAKDVVVENPIRLGLTCSDAKFPFFEHWQLLQLPRSDVHVTLIEKGEMAADLKTLKQILQITQQAELPKIKGMLENLAQIAHLSEKLAKTSLMSDRDYERIKRILPMGMEFRHILTLAKILGDRP